MFSRLFPIGIRVCKAQIVFDCNYPMDFNHPDIGPIVILNEYCRVSVRLDVIRRARAKEYISSRLTIPATGHQIDLNPADFAVRDVVPASLVYEVCQVSVTDVPALRQKVSVNPEIQLVIKAGWRSVKFRIEDVQILG